MSSGADLRVSHVAPMVEGNIVELVDMVKQMGRKGSVTESQNRRMVGYLGNLDEMRSQIVIMVQRYEDDSKVLKRLLELLDRIDDVKNLALTSEASQGTVEDPSISDKELAQRYDTPFNPLMVSTLNILDASGLFATNIHAIEEVEELEDDAGDEFWDHADDPAQIAPEEEPKEVTQINLSMSNMFLPTLFASGSNLPPPPPAEPVVDRKGKGRRRSMEIQPNEKRKGKGKQRASDSDESSASETESIDSDDDRRKKAKAPASWKRGIPSWGASSFVPAPGSSASSSRKQPTRPRPTDSYTGSGSSSESESESESYSGSSDDGARTGRRIPHPPPMPPPPTRKIKGLKTGPCEPTLCKICYESYSLCQELWTFPECSHTYCRECLQDYLTTNIKDGAVLDLVCPSPGCTTEVMPEVIKTLCTPDTFSKYERFTVLAALRADPNARWCPNVLCNNGIKYNAATMPWVHCNACQFEFCFHCMAERHDGAACGKEALAFLEKKRASEAEAMEKFVEFTGAFKAFVKPCPTCHSYIEKNDGCNHMTCGNQSCKAQFCWLCLNVYAPDHFTDDINFPDCYDKQYWTPPDMAAGFGAHNIYVQPPRTRRFANIAKKVGMYMGVGVAVVTLGVPAAVIGGPVYGCFQLHKRLKAKRRERRRSQAYWHHDANFVPPSPQRIAEAAREARRLYDMEHS